MVLFGISKVWVGLTVAQLEELNCFRLPSLVKVAPWSEERYSSPVVVGTTMPMGRGITTKAANPSRVAVEV